MIVVTGHLVVAPGNREAYLDDCVDVVRQARATPGCHDFSLSADIVDPGRINVLELWGSRDALTAFRGEGPSSEQSVALLEIHVQEFEVA